jgi:hypothetical protein
MEIPRILELSNIISKSVTALHGYLAARGLPFPSFDADAVTILPTEVSEAQDAVLDATSELHDLLLGPLNILQNHGSVRPSKSRDRTRSLRASLHSTITS